MPDSPVPVCATADVPPGSVKSFEVGDELVAVYNIDGSFYATEARCSHAAADLGIVNCAGFASAAERWDSVCDGAR